MTNHELTIAAPSRAEAGLEVPCGAIDVGFAKRRAGLVAA
jgi:hypothetical protein